jgi:4-hydroxybenzoate polyprenyltransferase
MEGKETQVSREQQPGSRDAEMKDSRSSAPALPRPSAQFPGLKLRLRTTLEMIKFSHTLFALPFALLAAFLAARGLPSWPTLAKILLAMVGARSAAMAHNRLADHEIDAVNPRTVSRALPSGALTPGFVRVFLVASVALFLVAAATLNRLTLLLSPVALGLLFFYSYTKRFTWLSHLVLGLCLALAPIGAWIAVTGSIAWIPILLGLAVLLWTAGFDILYALQDEEHDRKAGLQSLPARWGTRAALVASALLHAAMIPLLLAVWRLSGGGFLFAASILATAAALLYQHAIVKPGDLSRINAAFFTANGFVSVVLAVCGIADVLLRNT